MDKAEKTQRLREVYSAAGVHDLAAEIEAQATGWAGPGFNGPPAAPDPLPEEHYHWATDGRPGQRTEPPCHCGTPSLAHRPGLLRAQLRKQLRLQGTATLADLESIFLGHGSPWHRNDLIEKLAAMRDDGEVRFQGPRYMWNG